MTYGLCNAGATYQRLMDMCLSGLPADRIFTYMDDLVVFTSSLEEHVVVLRSIFDRLRASGIQLKPTKCLFAGNVVNFLGFELSHEGIKPQKRLTEAIINMDTPKSRKEVRRFLGMAGFYRCFIRNFAEIAEPLNKLTSENVTFRWTDHCETAFSKLKELLTTKPILAFPKPGELFVLEVDASDVAVGGVLSQFQGDKQLHPVAYFSTALTDSQKKWSTYNKETFALVMATRHWYVYLIGSQFIVRSDHNPLTHIQKKKDPHGKLGRWIAELEVFDFSIEHIAGRINLKADALSRSKSVKVNEVPDDLFATRLYSIDVKNDLFTDQLRTEQDNDVIISSAKIQIEQKIKVGSGQLKRVN